MFVFVGTANNDGIVGETLGTKLYILDTPTPKCHGIRSLLVVLFLLKL